MTLKEFKEYAKGEAPAVPLAKIKVIGNKIYIGKKLAVSFSESLDPKTRAYLSRITIQAGEALEDGEVLYTTRLYDMDELRRFERGAERLKKEMRIKEKPKRKK